MNIQQIARAATRGAILIAVLSFVAFSTACGKSEGLDAASSRGTAPTERFAEYFVAPYGNDMADGTSDRPFATVARAKEVVRKASAQMSGDILVNIRAGTYALQQPLEFTADDSGKNGHRIVYQAYGFGTPEQEQVVISGGKRISGWSLSDSRNNIWKADVADLETRQLYVNGQRAHRASLRNTLEMVEHATGYTITGFAQVFWTNPTDIEFVYERTAQNHSHPRCGVASILGNEVVMDQPCFRWFLGVQALGTRPSRAPSSFEGSLSFLRDPGTFVLDTTNPGQHILYYIPRPGENLLGQTEVIAPVLELLVHGNGTAESPVHDLTFRGLTFSHASWHHSSTERGYMQYLGETYENGDPGTYARSPDARQTPGNLLFAYSDRIALEGNRFEKLGAMALEIRGSQNIVRGNEITDTSSGGILIGHSQPETKMALAQGNVIDNNWIHDVGAEYFGATGIMAMYTKDLVISHNQINGLPDRGIYLWQVPQSDGVTIGGARILNNLVFDVMLRLGDGGGIYTIDHQGTSYESGSVIRGNVFRDTDSVTETVGGVTGVPVNIGLYSDYGSKWITMDSNVVYNVQHSAGNFSSAGPGEISELKYLRNFWIDEELYVAAAPPSNVTLEDNTVLPRENSESACRGIPACSAILDGAGLEPGYRHLLN